MELEISGDPISPPAKLFERLAQVGGYTWDRTVSVSYLYLSAVYQCWMLDLLIFLLRSSNRFIRHTTTGKTIDPLSNIHPY